ncbi:MAG: FixH family protein [Rhizobiaceae bacterium]|nr:FixH family protein [Rhizobiaceae bacterium]MCV0407434.1 FixH family protein [Rhizobiaceae bacterium]
MTHSRKTGPAEFTGRHMLAIMIFFFGVIIAVNVTMATIARTSWSGFVVRNSYVASQEFNERAAAARQQAARGWTSTLELAEGQVSFGLSDRQGQTIPLRSASVVLKSPMTDATDRVVELAVAGSRAGGGIDVRDGTWVVEVLADTHDGLAWHETRRITITGESLR